MFLNLCGVNSSPKNSNYNCEEERQKYLSSLRLEAQESTDSINSKTMDDLKEEI